MKRKIYYRYNPHTLTYERIYPSTKDKIFTVFRHLISGIVVGVAALILFQYFVGTPWSQERNKNDRLKDAQIEEISKKAGEMIDVLKDMQERDDNLYRALFHSDPLPASIRSSGVGSLTRYEHLEEVSNANLIVQTTKKIDYIAKQIYIQSNSFDEVLEMAKNQKDRLKHIPSIQPVPNKFRKKMASGYGMRIDPIYGKARFHAGMDFAADIGTPLYATGDGVFTHADWQKRYGNSNMLYPGSGY